MTARDIPHVERRLEVLWLFFDLKNRFYRLRKGEFIVFTGRQMHGWEFKGWYPICETQTPAPGNCFSVQRWNSFEHYWVHYCRIMESFRWRAEGSDSRWLYFVLSVRCWPQQRELRFQNIMRGLFNGHKGILVVLNRFKGFLCSFALLAHYHLIGLPCLAE